MSRLDANPLRSSGRLKRWVVGAAVVALAAWLFEFSTHLHLADSGDAGSPSAVHVCGYCAALQPGAGPASVAIHIPFAATGPVEPVRDDRIVSSHGPAPYRSRAPPTV